MQDLEDDLTSSPAWDSQEIPLVVYFIAFGVRKNELLGQGIPRLTAFQRKKCPALRS